MKKYLFTPLALLGAAIICNTASAQDSSRIVCGSDMYYQQHAKDQPAVKTHESDLNFSIANFVQQGIDTATIIIPVVFHVMHINGPENVNKKIIQDQIATLNEVYQKKE